jgi:hypothetical protein
MATREKYINPYTDFGFKKLFGTKANKELLIDFLNQLITLVSFISYFYVSDKLFGC